MKSTLVIASYSDARSILSVDTMARHRGKEVGTNADEAPHLVRGLGTFR